MPAQSPDRSDRRRALFPRPFLLSVIIAVLLTLGFANLVPRYAPGLLRFEHAMGDLRTARISDQLPSQHPMVAIVGITDRTLKPYKARLPIDAGLLARVVAAVDAAGPKVIGIDVLFVRPQDNEDALVAAIKSARAPVVMAAADERIALDAEQRETQRSILRQAGRPAGYANLATERDYIVRFKAEPAPGSIYKHSFAHVAAEAAGFHPSEKHRRIPWLRTPADHSDVFLQLSAETLFRAEDDPVFKAAREGLNGKIVIIGGLLNDIDTHLTPLGRMHGALLHAQILAGLVDGRSVRQLEADSIAIYLILAGITVLSFLVGWHNRLTRRGLLTSTVATAAIIAIDTITFWQFRIILPVVLALIAWFVGEFLGHYLGRWLGPRSTARWFVK
jgi:adenylate cyclase